MPRSILNFLIFILTTIFNLSIDQIRGGTLILQIEKIGGLKSWKKEVGGLKDWVSENRETETIINPIIYFSQRKEKSHVRTFKPKIASFLIIYKK